MVKQSLLPDHFSLSIVDNSRTTLSTAFERDFMGVSSGNWGGKDAYVLTWDKYSTELVI